MGEKREEVMHPAGFLAAGREPRKESNARGVAAEKHPVASSGSHIQLCPGIQENM